MFLKKNKKISTRGYGALLASIGFILSPLSWWNDLVVNFPLSYIIALPFGLIKESLFIPAFIGAYWLTNILGLLLLQKGSKKILKPEDKAAKFNSELKNTLAWGTVYTILIVILILSGVLTFPTEFLEKIK